MFYVGDSWNRFMDNPCAVCGAKKHDARMSYKVKYDTDTGEYIHVVTDEVKHVPAKAVKRRPTKAHLICFVMSEAKVPMRRVDVMSIVHTLEGKERCNFDPHHNNAYWRLGGSAGEVRNSIIIKGYAVQSGKLERPGIRGGRPILYALTTAGEQMAQAYRDWRRTNAS